MKTTITTDNSYKINVSFKFLIFNKYVIIKQNNSYIFEQSEIANTTTKMSE